MVPMPQEQPPAAHKQIWYVSYGSNMSRERLRCYLEGGRPPGGNVDHVGARDRTPPIDTAGVVLPGRLYFAGESRTWGGGMAFYDDLAEGPTYARAYRLTIGQFVDIAAQEMHRLPAADDPLEQVVATGIPHGRHSAGPGHYETLIRVGDRDGLPMLTFTAPGGADTAPHSAPRGGYLATLAEGLREAHGWSRRECDEYFARVSER